jgi:hypothetical protein
MDSSVVDVKTLIVCKSPSSNNIIFDKIHKVLMHGNISVRLLIRWLCVSIDQILSYL